MFWLKSNLFKKCGINTLVVALFLCLVYVNSIWPHLKFLFCHLNCLIIQEWLGMGAVKVISQRSSSLLTSQWTVPHAVLWLEGGCVDTCWCMCTCVCLCFPFPGWIMDIMQSWWSLADWFRQVLSASAGCLIKTLQHFLL